MRLLKGLIAGDPLTEVGEFFLLQDLVTEDCSAVKFFTPFEAFTTSPLPASIEVYRAYRRLAIEFIEARNCRIL